MFREALIHPEFDVIGYRLARCVGPAKYFQVVDAIMRSQEQVFAAPRDAYLNIAKSVGMSEGDFDKCVDDQAATKKLLDRIEKEREEYNVSGTPTFIVNGKTVGTRRHHPCRPLGRDRSPAREEVSHDPFQSRRRRRRNPDLRLEARLRRPLRTSLRRPVLRSPTIRSAMRTPRSR